MKSDKSVSNDNGQKLNTTENSSLCVQTGGLSYSVLVFAYMVVLLVASIIFSVAGVNSDSDAYIYTSYLISPIAIVITVIFIIRYRKQKPKEVFSFKCHPKYYVIGLLMIFGLMFCVSYTNEYSIEFFKLLGYTEPESSMPNLSGWNLFLAIIVIALIPAICEECVFRGLIYKNSECGTGSVAAVFLSGFLFSLYHGSPAQTVYQFICGCCFALLVMRSGAITPAVVIHFINNCLILVFNSVGIVDSFGYLAISSTANIIIIVISGLCFVVAIVWLILDKKPVVKQKAGETGKFVLWSLVGIVIMALIWLFSLFA